MTKILTDCIIHTSVCSSNSTTDNPSSSSGPTVLYKHCIVLQGNTIQQLLPESDVFNVFPPVAVGDPSVPVVSPHDLCLSDVAKHYGCFYTQRSANGSVAGKAEDAGNSEKVELISINGLHITAGFIDVQLNGCGGQILNGDMTSGAIDNFVLTCRSFGTTSFLPTLITCTDEEMQAAVEVVRSAINEDYRSYNPTIDQLTYDMNSNFAILGVHLEGPHLSPFKKGIHNEKLFRQIEPHMEAFYIENSDVIRIITLAPEECLAESRNGHSSSSGVSNLVEDKSNHTFNGNGSSVTHKHGRNVLERLSAAGIILSAGHSNATFKEAIQGFRYGIQMCTHLYNAMRLETSREAGLVGAILDTPHIYATVIVDGVHVAFPNTRLAAKVKGDKFVLITDSLSPAGLVQLDKLREHSRRRKEIESEERNVSNYEKIMPQHINSKMHSKHNDTPVTIVPAALEGKCIEELTFTFGSKTIYVIERMVSKGSFDFSGRNDTCAENCNIKRMDYSEDVPVTAKSFEGANGDVAGSGDFHRSYLCVDEHSSLAGSVLTMIGGIQNMVSKMDVSLEEALRMASLYPARLLKMDKFLGSVEEGKIANFAIFDNNLKVHGAITGGNIYWN